MLFRKTVILLYFIKNENREWKVIEVEIFNSFYGKSSRLWRERVP